MMSLLNNLFVSFHFWIIKQLNWIGSFLPPLALRLLLAWEYWEAGVNKFNGQNWFASVQDKFLYPFNMIPVEINWQIAMWFELVGAIALVLGLATRFFSFSLIILTVVAIASVHWPEQWNTWSELLTGYTMTDKGFGDYKLPLIFLIMLLPLLFTGPGKLSLDYLIWRRLSRPTYDPNDIHK